MAKQCNGTFYFQYQKLIQTFDNLSLSSLKLTDKFVSEKLLSSRWLYCKDLVGHFGCVNAIEFCNKGGEYLVSGGDDTRILVWRLNEAVKGETTARCLKGKHHSNIFCVSFDSENKHILSAGNDDQILRHDFEIGELVNCFTANDATYDVCVHPENNNIFITAGEHGEVDLYDVRTPTEQIKLAQGPPTFHSAIYNPVDPAVFATASSVKGVELWDARVPLRCFKRFDSNAGIQCAMGVAFDQTGRYVAAVRRRLPPVIYHINRTTSLVEFYQKGYYNSCTMKSVCFGGKKDNYIISGSDDFNVYMWSIPEIDKNHEGIFRVENSFQVLNGHRSIVNQVCYNKHTSMICTAGVEKIIKMWSPFPLADGKGLTEDTKCEQRTPYSQLDYARMIIESGQPLSHNYDDQSTSEDPRMIAFFDTLVQKERDGSSTDSDLSSTDDDEDNAEQRSSNVDMLRRIRAMIFEHMRSQRENQREENLNDSNSTESSERNFEESGSQELETRNTTEISDENTVDEVHEQGVGLERLREIITSQQGARNACMRKRIAELRRDCLKNGDENAVATTSSTVSLTCKDQESNSTQSRNESSTITSENDTTFCQTREKNGDKQDATNSGTFLEREDEGILFENGSKSEHDLTRCSSKPWRGKPNSRKHKEEDFSDLPTCSENDRETNDYERRTRSNENSETLSVMYQHCDTEQLRNTLTEQDHQSGSLTSRDTENSRSNSRNPISNNSDVGS